jgi:hypothetical protein
MPPGLASGDGRGEVDEEDQEIAHCHIVARKRKLVEFGAN